MRASKGNEGGHPIHVRQYRFLFVVVGTRQSWMQMILFAVKATTFDTSWSFLRDVEGRDRSRLCACAYVCVVVACVRLPVCLCALQGASSSRKVRRPRNWTKSSTMIMVPPSFPLTTSFVPPHAS